MPLALTQAGPPLGYRLEWGADDVNKSVARGSKLTARRPRVGLPVLG